MRQLGDLEAVVMNRLWAWQRSATVREVLEDVNSERKLAYTTVQTVMDNLQRKGLLAREVHGRAYRYVAVRTKAEHAADLIASVLADSDDRTAPLLRFVENMTAPEVARLRESLDAAHTPAVRLRSGRGKRGSGTRS